MAKVKIGILGGGQLGKMLIEAFGKLTQKVIYTNTTNTIAADIINVEFYVMDPNFDCPCAKMENVNYFQGDLYDKTSLSVFASYCDVMTYEIEHIDCETLIELEENGKRIHPSGKVLKIIQDKFEQKSFFKKHNLPTLYFSKINSYSKLLEVMDSHDVEVDINNDKNNKNNETFAVLKSMRGGYDGKGVVIVHRNDMKVIENFIYKNRGEIMYEHYLEKKTELSVLISRDSENNVVAWPPVEMIFDNNTNIMNYMFSPSKLSKEIQSKAVNIGKRAIEKLDGVGVFAIEMFVDDEENIYINEISPRPHNSSHHTINCSALSVYESLAKILLKKPLTLNSLTNATDTSGYILTNRCALKNIIGDEYGRYRFTHKLYPTNTFGHINIFGNGTVVYDYNKSISKPGRKLGHIIVKDGSGRNNDLLCALDNEYSKLSVEILNTPKVGIIMGSTSDWPTMKAACDILDELNVDYEKTVVSAHRTPERLYEYANKARDRCVGVIIAGAGGAAHLPGMVASMTTVPVIGVPVKTSTLSGMDSLYSIVQMPPGVPVATVAIGGAKNAGILAAQILGLVDSKIIDNLESYKRKMKDNVTFLANSI